MELYVLHSLRFSDKLRPMILDAALEIRRQVFQQEQQIPADRDRDERDETAMQFVVMSPLKGTYPMFTAIATARVTLTLEGFLIGRMAVLQYYRLRNSAVGKHLMKEVLRTLRGINGDRRIYLHAQNDPDKNQDVVGFYNKLGFVPVNERFQIVGIWHQEMYHPLVKPNFYS